MELDWPDLLDALEERNRRCAAALAATDPEELPDLELTATGPLPPALVPRAALLLADTQRLEGLLTARVARARLALHYGT